MNAGESDFCWDPEKERLNILKHGIDFRTAMKAFADPRRKILTDERHSRGEPRFFCVGTADGKIVTVRFTYREGKIRILGAGHWRKGRRFHEEG